MGGAWELAPASRALAEEMLRTPIAQLSQTLWRQDTAADLRRFLIQQIESHAERRLATAKLFAEPQPEDVAPEAAASGPQ
jgi:hypothetical protein